MGFAMIAILFFTMGITFKYFVEKKAPGAIFIVLYGLSFFFSNFGPNTSTYAISGEVFPSTVAATCHGISSAFGKLGAFIGSAIFSPVYTKYGAAITFYGCAVVALLGLLLTFLITDSTKKEMPTVAETESLLSLHGSTRSGSGEHSQRLVN
eukprot:TRINITY_DN2716_c0_g1_i1.p1 TRINITY_DN2716_c0_g1~~TRINITY_DN2716_c0_g1_i1.p1  ORF type:complete len:176 (+),score=16.32 TRINITY_DN2716_c0_g1_i1:73-528(+)